VSFLKTVTLIQSTKYRFPFPLVLPCLMVGSVDRVALFICHYRRLNRFRRGKVIYARKSVK
jgi:hypothetical protein